MEFKKVNVGRIKEKLDKSGINRPYYIIGDVPLYKVKEGDNYIRILPPIGDIDDFGLDIWVHSFLGPDRGSYLCVEKTHIEGLKRKKCMLCDLYRRIQGKNEDLTRALAPRRRTLYWILDVSDKPQSEEPLLFDAPYKQVAEEILMRCIDRRTGEIIDISDIEEGREVIFRMTKQTRKYPEYKAIELGNKYKISPKLARKIIPLSDVIVMPDEAEIVELVDILYEYGNSYEDTRTKNTDDRFSEEMPKFGKKFEDKSEEMPKFAKRFEDRSERAEKSERIERSESRRIDDDEEDDDLPRFARKALVADDDDE